MRSKTVCFTGHRELPADDLPEISKRLEDTLATLRCRYPLVASPEFG